MGVISFDELLDKVKDRKLTIDDIPAFTLFGYDAPNDLATRLRFDERNRNISTDDVWDRVKNREIDGSLIYDMYKQR